MAALRLVDLADPTGTPALELSGGQRRRLSLACALVHAPRVLFLDEPTVGVDPQSRNAILESIEALSVEGMAVLYTTHYMEEAERLCDRIGIIDSGRLQAEGTRDELVRMIGGVDTIRLAGSGDLAGSAAELREIPGVVRVDTERRAATLTVKDAPALVAQVVGTVTSYGVTLSDVEIVRPDLEQVFLYLTGKGLRD